MTSKDNVFYRMIFKNKYTFLLKIMKLNNDLVIFTFISIEYFRNIGHI